MKPVFGGLLNLVGLIFFLFPVVKSLKSLKIEHPLPLTLADTAWWVGIPGSLPCYLEVGKVMESSEWQPVVIGHSSYELRMKSGICI